MKDKALENILNRIKYTNKEAVQDARIVDSLADLDSLTLSFTIEFPKVIKVEDIASLNSSIKNNLSFNDIYTKNINVTYTYVDKMMTSDELKSYYTFIVKALKEKKILYKSLDSFNVEFSSNEIKLLVGDEKDKIMITPLFNMVEKSFKALGIDFINFIIEINSFILATNDSIKSSKEEDVLNALNAADSYTKSSEIKEEPKKEKNFRMRNTQKINGKPTDIKDIPMTEAEIVEYTQKNGSCNFVIVGKVSNMEITVTKNGYQIYSCTVSDNTGSIQVKTFINSQRNGYDIKFYEEKANNGDKVRIYGYAQYDKYSRDVVLQLLDIISNGKMVEEGEKKVDDAPLKRVELHTHSKMTFLDSVLDIDAYVDRAIEYGHRAIALTDKNTVQGLGEFLHTLQARKSDILPIYGMEASFVDEDSCKVAYDVNDGCDDIDLKEASYVVLDFETTGLSANYNRIIEIGACKVYRGEIIDEFSTFVNPKCNITSHITKLTSITNDDVRNAPTVEEIMPKFLEFCKGCILVAHNASFDAKVLHQNLRRLGLYNGNYPFIDTLDAARTRYSHKMKKFGLDELCKCFGVVNQHHHRACDDAKATALCFIKMINDYIEDGYTNYKDINKSIKDEDRYKYVFPSHLTILCKNREGLVNLNRIVSDSNTTHFYKGPRTTKKMLDEHRNGLLIGSSCYHGDVFDTAFNGTYEELLEVVDYFDYIEVQPLACYSYVVNKNDLDEEDIKDIVLKIIKAGKEKNKIVVATGDVHELNKEDSIYRKMIYAKPLIGGGIHELANVEELPVTYFRNTQEMLDEFAFLGDELAMELVVTNSNKITDMIERYNLFPDKLFAPGDDFMAKFGIPSAKQAVYDQTYQTAREKYGENLPKIVEERIEKELNSIIGHGYGSIYYIAYLLVNHSREAGYVVGSRGSVGSSLVATFMKITEVNSLAPHYVCPHCKFSAFRYTDEEIKKYNPSKEELELQEILQKYNTGPDLPKHKCPICGEEMNSDGYNIPFETFLGFEGDKVPDIDLNFSGEYQPKAHSFCREIFGVDNTFRGGTIGTIAQKTAENYITDYYAKNGKMIRRCEVATMTPFIQGIKRQTGQHPGGIVVVPEGIDINEITPVQFPADDITSDWKTTHIDYHKFEANLLKLDILGHDDPTMIRYLMNFVEANPQEFPFARVEDIPVCDENVMKLFSGVEVLGVTPLQIKSEIGSTGLPEFGTTLSRDMLNDIRPKTISELIKISGLSHGTNVWQGNAKDYFMGTKGNYGKIPFDELIGCRDDIMVHLIQKGLPAKNAFKIMESVRKGRGLNAENEALMRKYNVEGWFIDSCKIIKYLFPKAHATAYVIMALRIAWFKLYKPLCYYSGFFSKRTDAFDIQAMVGGYDAILAKVNELSKYGKAKDTNDEDSNDSSGFEDSSTKKMEKTLVGLQLALEMVARGYTFKPVHVNYSDSCNFLIEGNSLRIPLIAIDSFGENTAKAIVANRGDTPFTSIQDAMRRGHISNSLAEKLDNLGAFEGLPKDDEIGIFKFLTE